MISREDDIECVSWCASQATLQRYCCCIAQPIGESGTRLSASICLQ